LAAGDEGGVEGEGTFRGDMGERDRAGGGGVTQLVEVGRGGLVAQRRSPGAGLVVGGLERRGGAVAQLADHGGQLAELLVRDVTGAGGSVQRGGDAGLGLLSHDISLVVVVLGAGAAPPSTTATSRRTAAVTRCVWAGSTATRSPAASAWSTA